MTPTLDIVANIHVGETKPERVRMLLSSIRSFEFFKDHCRWFMLAEHCSPALRKLIEQTFRDCGFSFNLAVRGKSPNYGENYCDLLKYGKAPFVLNFIEDHFCVLDSCYAFLALFDVMALQNIDVFKATFFQIERECAKYIKPETHHYIYTNGITEHKAYNSSKYGQRFYIGVNFITTYAFAYKFWSRPISGPVPHPFELAGYDPLFEHRVMVPAFEVLASIDDPHGAEGSHLLARPNETKFWNIYNSIQL